MNEQGELSCRCSCFISTVSSACAHTIFTGVCMFAVSPAVSSHLCERRRLDLLLVVRDVSSFVLISEVYAIAKSSILFKTMLGCGEDG
jgi:hypothetical protein